MASALVDNRKFVGVTIDRVLSCIAHISDVSREEGLQFVGAIIYF